MIDLIDRVAFIDVVVPLDTTIGFSTRTVTQRCYLLVEVESHGMVGTGFCYAGHGGVDALSTLGIGVLADVVLGSNALATYRTWSHMRATALLHGRDGLTARVISALDIALWDLKGRLLGRPLHELVGGLRSEALAYASGGYYAPTSTPDDIEKEVGGYLDQGFTAVKIKVGRESSMQDAARIAAARETLGPGAPLMLDANNAWDTVIEARQAIKPWLEHDLYWLEEPFGPDQIQSHRRLSRMIDVPIATGELQAGLDRFYAYMADRAAPIIQPDAAVCGGITAFLRLLPIAEATGTSVCPHWFHELHAPLVAASESVTWIECFPDDRILNFKRLLASTLPLRDGHLQLSDEPGNGLVFDPEAVRAFQVARQDARK